MMKNSVAKILTIILVAILIASISTFVLADMPDPGDFDGDTSTAAAQSVEDMANTIIGIIQVVAVAVAVIMLIVLAIKYISAAPEGKAEIKKHAVIYIVGAVLLFGTTGVLQILKDFGEDLTSSV